MSTAEERDKIRTVSSVLQPIVWTIGIGVIVFHAGTQSGQVSSNAKEIAELRGIATDLVKSQVLAAATDSHQAEKLAELSQRITELSNRRTGSP